MAMLAEVITLLFADFETCPDLEERESPSGFEIPHQHADRLRLPLFRILPAWNRSMER